MGIRQREWARRQTAILRAALGDCCAVCGTRDKLEFDTIRPTGDRHHKMEWSWRLSFYRRQASTGNLQLLCTRHNAIKGDGIIDTSLVLGAVNTYNKLVSACEHEAKRGGNL